MKLLRSNKRSVLTVLYRVQIVIIFSLHFVFLRKYCESLGSKFRNLFCFSSKGLVTHGCLPSYSFLTHSLRSKAKQWMSFCGYGQNGVSKICVDGCDVVSENSGSDVTNWLDLNKS